MNRFVTRVLPTAALGTVLLLSAAAWSKGPREGFDSERMLAHMSEKLELTESQEQQAQEIFAADRDQIQADHTRMREIREALEAQQSDYNAGETQKLADELGEITSRMAYQMTSNRAELHQLLTPEQRQEMDEMKEAREGRRGERRSKHERGD